MYCAWFLGVGNCDSLDCWGVFDSRQSSSSPPHKCLPDNAFPGTPRARLLRERQCFPFQGDVPSAPRAHVAPPCIWAHSGMVPARFCRAVCAPRGCL